MCLTSTSGREARADCRLWAFLVGVGTGLPGATVLLRALVHTILQGCQTRLHHQDHGQGSPSSGSAAKAHVGAKDVSPVKTLVMRRRQKMRLHHVLSWQGVPSWWPHGTNSQKHFCPFRLSCGFFLPPRLSTCFLYICPYHCSWSSVSSWLCARWQVCGNYSFFFLLFNSYVFYLATRKSRDL